MITVGTIIDKQILENGTVTYSVTLSVFRYPGEDKDPVFSATCAVNPGTYEPYSVGDNVYVGFFQNEYHKPVILGKILKDIPENSKETPSTYQYIDDLTVNGKTILSEDTKIGDIEYENLLSTIRIVNGLGTSSSGGGEGPSYSEGYGIDINSSNEISVDTSIIQEKLEAGDNITIEDNVISASSGTTYSAGNGINIESDEISVDESVVATKEDLESYQEKLDTQTVYTSKGSATKVPQITTNSLGQVTNITEVTITDNNDNQTIKGNGTSFGNNDVVDIVGSGIVSVSGNDTTKEITISASHQDIKTLKTDNTTAQTTSSSEAINGSGTINLHKVSKTGSYNDLLNKPTIPTDTNQKVKTSSVTFGDNDVVEIVGGSNITVTGNATNKTITIDGVGDTHYTNSLTVQANGTDAVVFTQNVDKTLNIKGSGATSVSKTDDGEITVSSTDTTYTAGTNIQIDGNNQISATDTTYTNGTGLNLNGDEFSVDTTTIATRQFVNSSIATNTATFRGTYNIVTDLGLTTSATEQQIASALATKMTTLGITPTNNDYVFVAYPDATDPTQFTKYDRYKYNGDDSVWEYEFTLNNSSFTAQQWDAINSGITSNLVTQIGTNQTDISNIKDGTTIDSFGDVESALNGKVDSNTAITGATKCKITYDSKGLVTSGADLQASDIPNLDASKTTSGTFDVARIPSLSYLPDSTKYGASLSVSGTSVQLKDQDGNNLGSAITTQDTTYSDATQSVSGLMSANDKTKLDNIESGAEVNVQADWNEADSNSDSYIKNKPTIPSVNDGTLTINQNNALKGTFTANQSSNTIIDLTDTTYESKTASQGGTAVSLVTTGEKYTWNSKQDALTSQTSYTSKGTSTKVPTISTNSLGQVTSISETSISFPVTDIQVNGTSILSSGVGNLLTNTAYDSSTNKLATMSDIPSLSGYLPLVGGTMTGTINAQDITPKTGGDGAYNLGLKSFRWNNIWGKHLVARDGVPNFSAYIVGDNYTTTPSATKSAQYLARDDNGQYLGGMRVYHNTDGSIETQLMCRSQNTNIQNYVMFWAAKDATANTNTGKFYLLPNTSGNIGLGSAGHKWKDYYGAGNIYLGETSAVDKEIAFQTNGTTRAKIRGASGGAIIYQSDYHYFATANNSNRLILDSANKNIRPESNNGYDLGTTSYRFKDLYLSNSINNGTYAYSLPSANGTLALTNDYFTYYATCSTAGGTKDKVATVVDGTFTLRKGVIVGVKFANTNTYSATTTNKITLNVDNTGAFDIYYGNNPSPTGTNTICFGSADHIMYYMYDGTYWVFMCHSQDNNSTGYLSYSSTSVSNSDTNTQYLIGKRTVSNNATTYYNSSIYFKGNKLYANLEGVASYCDKINGLKPTEATISSSGKITIETSTSNVRHIILFIEIYSSTNTRWLSFAPVMINYSQTETEKYGTSTIEWGSSSAKRIYWLDIDKTYASSTYQLDLTFSYINTTGTSSGTVTSAKIRYKILRDY